MYHASDDCSLLTATILQVLDQEIERRENYLLEKKCSSFDVYVALYHELVAARRIKAEVELRLEKYFTSNEG